MITKDYKCKKCGAVYEIRQSIKDEPPMCMADFPERTSGICGGKLEWIPKANENKAMLFNNQLLGAISRRFA